MNDFEKLRKRLSLIKVDEQSDNKFVKEITNLKNLRDSQEKYYNSIPSYIRTANTLANITDRILKKIIYLENYERKKTYVAEAMYVQERTLKENAEEENTITIAYLEQSTNSITQKDDKIPSLELAPQEKIKLLSSDKEVEKYNSNLTEQQDVELKKDSEELTNRPQETIDKFTKKNDKNFPNINKEAVSTTDEDVQNRLKDYVSEFNEYTKIQPILNFNQGKLTSLKTSINNSIKRWNNYDISQNLVNDAKNLVNNIELQLSPNKVIVNEQCVIQ